MYSSAKRMATRWIQPLTRASPPINPSPHHILLGLDWDDTITNGDTIAALKHICRARDHRLSFTPPPTHLDKLWSEFVTAYLVDRADHKTKHYPSGTFDIAGYKTWLRSLGPVERRSIARVGASGVFAGVQREDVEAGARTAYRSGDVRLRRGWDELLAGGVQRAERHGENGVSWTPHIVSVNWSATFIRQCLLAGLDDRLERGEKTSSVHRRLRRFVAEELRIDAAEIEGLDAPDGSNGAIVGDLHDSGDKLARFKAAGEASSSATQIYVGDSSTDFECLTHADVGAWLHDASETALAENFGKTFAPLDIDIHPPHGINLAWASDLTTITHWLSSLESTR